MAAKPNPKEDGFCEGIYGGNSDGAEPQKIELYKLTNKKVLATTLCWRGAYNEGYGAWVLDESLNGKAMFVTESASDFDSGIISSAQRDEALEIAGQVKNGYGAARVLCILRICGRVCVKAWQQVECGSLIALNQS